MCLVTSALSNFGYKAVVGLPSSCWRSVNAFCPISLRFSVWIPYEYVLIFSLEVLLFWHVCVRFRVIIGPHLMVHVGKWRTYFCLESFPCAELSNKPWRHIAEWRYSSTHSYSRYLLEGRFIRGEVVPLSIGTRLGGFQVWFGLFGEGILYELCVFNMQLVVCMFSCSFVKIKLE